MGKIVDFLLGSYPHTLVSTVRILFLALCFVVNYRGSTGFGQDSILSLAGNIGSQDVKDVQVPSELSAENDYYSVSTQGVSQVANFCSNSILLTHLVQLTSS